MCNVIVFQLEACLGTKPFGKQGVVGAIASHVGKNAVEFVDEVVIPLFHRNTHPFLARRGRLIVDPRRPAHERKQEKCHSDHADDWLKGCEIGHGTAGT